MQSQIEILRELRKDYQDRMVSALIGAGFSKNVSEKYYLSWNGLLSDMIDDLYKEELEAAYDRYCKTTYPFSRSTKEEFLWKYRARIAERDGYLEIVSKYWKRKGFREAIETYVEERTPYLFTNDGKPYIDVDGRKIEITENAFNTHVELLKCERFCNFFTTNYDNLLEAIDERWSVADPKREKMNCVTKRDGLSDSMRKASIIKIHGDLRNPHSKKEEFVFDKDYGLRYILAKEDYENYSSKHEAFAYFMRIAMLSGRFCLMGFSGTDPNYLSWVDWMKDVISSQDTESTKVYFINVDDKEKAECIPSYKSLFYKNHGIKQLDLFNEDVIKELNLDDGNSIYDEKDGDLKKGKKTRQELLIGLFRYLRKEENPNNSEGDNQQKNESGHSSPVFMAFGNSGTTKKILDYQSLWNAVLRKITTKEDYAKDIEDIKTAKSTHRFFKSYSIQREIAFRLYSKQTEWSDLDAETFLLAAEDAGLLNIFFDEVKNNVKINKKELFFKHSERAITLKGGRFDDINTIDGNWNTYERILRCLFHLNYYGAKTLAENWDASGTWLLNKAMVLCWFEDKVEDVKQILDAYIKDKSHNEQERMFASVYGNILSRIFPLKYDYSEFRTKNTDDLNAIIDFYMQDAIAKLQKPVKRGSIDNTINLGIDKGQLAFESGLRTLLFIINTAMPLEYTNVLLLNSSRWYALFSRLYVKYPDVCFYYSTQYNEKNVLTRIGQDFASCRELDGVLTDILITGLQASADDFFPKYNLDGLYYITAQMYIVVDEDIWYNAFCKNILELFFSSISNQKRQDALYTNVALACVAMADPKRIATTIENLLLHFADNPSSVTSLICDSMNLGLLDEKEAGEIFGNAYDDVVRNNPLSSTIRIIYVFQYHDLLNDSRHTAAVEMLDKNVELLKTFGKDSLIFACSVKGKSKNVTNELKRIILSSNIWFNGKLEGGGWTCPDRIPVNQIINELEFSDEELQVLINNLSKNVKGLMEYIEKHGRFSLFGDYYLDYLNDALDFISICEKKRLCIDLSHIDTQIRKIYTLQTNTDELTEMLMSNDVSTFSNALDRLNNILRISSLGNYKREFSQLLNRAILKEPLALNKLIRTIFLISNKHKDELRKCGFVGDLLMLLTVMHKAEKEYSTLNFNLYRGFNNLYFLAHMLKNIGVEDQSITYWMTDKFVLKFVKNRIEG